MARGSPCLVPSADIILVLHRHCNEKTSRLSIGVYHVGRVGRMLLIIIIIIIIIMVIITAYFNRMTISVIYK